MFKKKPSHLVSTVYLHILDIQQSTFGCLFVSFFFFIFTFLTNKIYIRAAQVENP